MDTFPKLPTTTSTTSTTTTSPHNRINLNVGGTLFSTTTTTLLSTAPNSLLTTLSTTHNLPNHPIFIDRDPDIFRSLLSLLRHCRLPSTALTTSSPHHLLRESLFYGIDSLLKPSLSPPPLSPFDASISHSLSPPSSPFVSAISSADDFSLLLAHTGQISSYDVTTLLRLSTIRTHLDDISSICHVSPEIAAVGSNSSAGIHFYSISARKQAGEALWLDPADLRTNKARVTAIGGDSSSDSVFASFECRHGENAILIVDKTTLKVVAEIGRQSGTAAKSSAMNKLTWTPAVGLLVGSSVTCGAFGYSGRIRVWDPRAGGEEVWETSEPGCLSTRRVGDVMADVDVDPDGLFLAKVGSRTGDLGVADMRKLGPDPWVYLEDLNPGMSVAGAATGKIVVVHCYKKHVFVGREGGLEAWSKVEERELEGEEKEWGGVYRRNYVDKVEDAERGVIWKIQGGGNRLFVCRENVEGVEVWESSGFSGVKMVL